MADEIPNNNVITTSSVPSVDNTNNSDALINKESALFNVSIRGWLATILTVTLCYMSLRTIKVEEPFSSICVFALGFYFGQKKN